MPTRLRLGSISRRKAAPFSTGARKALRSSRLRQTLNRRIHDEGAQPRPASYPSKTCSRSCAVLGVIPRCVRDSLMRSNPVRSGSSARCMTGMKRRSRPERKRPSSSSDCNLKQRDTSEQRAARSAALPGERSVRLRWRAGHESDAFNCCNDAVLGAQRGASKCLTTLLPRGTM